MAQVTVVVAGRMMMLMLLNLRCNHHRLSSLRTNATEGPWQGLVATQIDSSRSRAVATQTLGCLDIGVIHDAVPDMTLVLMTTEYTVAEYRSTSKERRINALLCLLKMLEIL